jgi:hypothetical protein
LVGGPQRGLDAVENRNSSTFAGNRSVVHSIIGERNGGRRRMRRKERKKKRENGAR